MKAENRGIKAKKNRKLTARCSICGMQMDCPESMQGANGHFCARCTDLMARGYEPEELKKHPEDIAQHLPGCDKVSMLLTDLAFDSYWKKVMKHGIEHFDNEMLVKEFYFQGASSMAALFISAGMPPEFLDELADGMKGAKNKVGDKK
jgi:hypothetical protein